MKNFSSVRLGETDDIKETYEKEAQRKLISPMNEIKGPFSPAVHLKGCAKAFKFDLIQAASTLEKPKVTLSNYLTTKKDDISTPQACLKEAKYDLKVFLPS